MAESNQEMDRPVLRKCKPCLNKDIYRAADIFCSTCKEFQCNDCSKGHNIYAFMKNHKVLSVSGDPIELDAKYPDTVNMDGLDICNKHKKRYKFYCEEDKALLCSTCAIIDHRFCRKVAELENIGDKSQCQTLRAKLKRAIRKTNQVIANLKEVEAFLIDDVQKIHENLSKLRTNIIQMFDDFAEKLAIEANSYRDQTTADWADRKLECETKLKDMEITLNTIDDVATNGTPAQQFIRVHNATETIQNDVKNVDTLCADLGTLNVSCNFNRQIDIMKSNLVSAMSSDEFDIKYHIPKKTKLEPIASIDLKPTGDDAVEPFYTGLDFLPDGRLVAVDYKNSQCLIYDANLNMKSAYKLPYKTPFDVVVVSDDEIAITTGGGYRLVFLHVNRSNQITLNRTCKVSVKYDSICIHEEDENFVVSTYDHDTPVRIVSMSVEEKDLDIEFPSKKYVIDTSSCTYIRGQDKLVLTDLYADTVHIYNVRTGEVIKDVLIKAPSGVTIGANDRLFIGSKSTSTLVEITPSGRVLASHQVDLKQPRFIAVSKDKRRLALSNSASGSRKLNLYKILSE